MRLSVRQFQELFHIVEMDLPDIELSTIIVKTLTGKSDAEIENMPVKKFNKICRDAKKSIDAYVSNVDKKKAVKFLKVNGNLYQLHYDMRRMNAGKYVEAATFSQEPIKNLHKILATMAVPMHWTWGGLRAKPYNEQKHEEIAEDMLDADFEVAYAACVFFCKVWAELIKNLNTYGSNPQEEEILERLLRLSQKYGVGYIMESK